MIQYLSFLISVKSYALNLTSHLSSYILLFIVWNPDPIALDLGLLKISWYGLTWSFSIVIGYLLTKAIFSNEKKNVELTTTYVQYIFFGSMIGARIFDVFYYHFSEFLARPLMLFEIWKGGLASHGAVLGVLLAMYIFVKRHKEFSFIWCLDRAAIMAPILGGFIRIGNFINSELVGKVTTVPWAVIFPNYSYSLEPRHPVQLYEALWLFICFGIFWYLLKSGPKKDGFFVGLFLAMVLSGRLLLEFLKESTTYYGFLSNTQWLSLLGAVIGIGILLKLNRNPSKSNPSIS